MHKIFIYLFENHIQNWSELMNFKVNGKLTVAFHYIIADQESRYKYITFSSM